MTRFAFFLFLLLPFLSQAQGAWTPANGDASFPRTLCKTQEIPAILNHIQQAENFGLFTALWNDLLSYNPGAGNFVSDGARRNAARRAKNAAFFLLIDRKPDNGALVSLSPSDKVYLQDRAIFLLEHINTAVAQFPNLGGYLWRSNEITNNVIAYDLLKGAGVPDSLLTTSKDLLIEYCGNLHGEIEFNFLNLGFFGLHVDNHALRTCGALGLAAVVLSDESNSDSDRQPWKWFETSLYNIDNVLWQSPVRQSEENMLGGYSEGPHYLRFGMKHVLPFFHALGNFVPDTTFNVSFNGDPRNVDHPWHDDNYDRLFEWIARIRMPDGRSPSLEDCFVATAWEELAIWEKPEYCPKVDYSRWHPIQPNSLWEMLHHSSDDVVADYLCSMTSDQTQEFDLLQVLPNSGNVVFRSGWDSTATYLHFSAKNGLARSSAQGHNQADASSFMLSAHGEILALDAGYLKWDRRDEVGKAENHSMVLVDGSGPATGSIANANGADAYAENDFDLRDLDYAEVRTAYQGTDIVRKALMLRRNHFLLADQMSSGQSHTYRWQLHGYGLENGDSLTGYFDWDGANGRGLYRKNDALLEVVTVADGGNVTYSRATADHEWRYDSLQQHTAFYADVAGSNAAFLSAMVPYATDTPMVSILGNPSDGAVVVQAGGYTDVATVSGMAAASSVGLVGDLVSDGGVAVYSVDQNGDFAHFFMENGSEMTLGNGDVCSTSVAMDLALEVRDSAMYTGFASTAGTVWLPGLEFEPLSVNGLHVSSWQYDIPSQTLVIVMDDEGYFNIHEGVVIGVEEEMEGEMKIWPVPAQDVLKVALDEAQGRLLVIDALGRTARSVNVNTMETQINVQSLRPGIYGLIWVLPDGRRHSRKFLVN